VTPTGSEQSERTKIPRQLLESFELPKLALVA